MVTNDWALKHADWHRANDLHAAGCALLRTRGAQRHTGAFVVPQSCTCGLIRPDERAPSS